MKVLSGYEWFFKSSLDQLLEGNDGSVCPAGAMNKMNQLAKVAMDFKLFVLSI